ncbi:Ubiquinol-cytochrome c reductase hinge protein [Handroanthus impetiginosus]|uniref:Ubiquinol-cytochrome c reductase hinge protein n=1 Tax=Handroanthus impetiginosus TaxID=429701 RepID=A0A2G9FZF1_9LAMI|nr:Ubiquinol-cytochrome c reductase hinge protein [Handroanthus impetiginosus]
MYNLHVMIYRAEKEIVDRNRVPEDSCRSKCTKAYVDYQRVEGDESKHCTGQYFDYRSCIDKFSGFKCSYCRV